MSLSNEENFTFLIQDYVNAIKDKDEDEEMKKMKELKYQFKLTDDQITRKALSFFYKQKADFKPALKDSVDLSTIKPLTYLMDGWLLKGDVSLTYGSYGSGKTTHALYKAYKFAQGINILDRNAPCKKGKTLFCCTDGGVNTFKKGMNDLGLNEDDEIFAAGENQKIFVWGYDPTQGHKAWKGDINDIIKLEAFVKKEDIDNVVFDSAKSISSRAGWSYMDNDSVRVFLQYLREIIAQQNKCHMDILSHDGTASGSHAGAKSWAEEASVVIHLKAKMDEDTKEQIGVIAEFKKDRAATIEPRRSILYKLNNCEMELVEEKEIVGNCEKKY